MTAEVRRIVLNELKNAADLVTVPRADGAFYFLLRIHKNADSMELVRRLIEEHKVAVIPGETFGMKDKCYLRVAYGPLHEDTAAEGIARLVHGLKAILGR
jgi:aspartate/methionine/tyrosine aminotransferase